MFRAAVGARDYMELWSLERGSLTSKVANCVMPLKCWVLHRLVSVSDRSNCVFQSLENSLVSLPLICCTQVLWTLNIRNTQPSLYATFRKPLSTALLVWGTSLPFCQFTA